MGFSQARAEDALRRVGTNRLDVAMEWLISHPEEPAAAAGAAAAAAAAQPVAGTGEKELSELLFAPGPQGETLSACSGCPVELSGSYS